MNIMDLTKNVDESILITKPDGEWIDILKTEVNIYVYGTRFLAKRYDQIQYQFVSKDDAKEILEDNLYASLRHKYFHNFNDDTYEKIERIVRKFKANIKTLLPKVTFNPNADGIYIKQIPAGCMAFKNGVYDFNSNKWLFKYNITEVASLHNRVYDYRNDYAILWHMNYNFEPLPFGINEFEFGDFYEIMKELNNDDRNYCFELLHNMCHDSKNEFSLSRLQHLSEIMGYLTLTQMSQHLVMLVGSGQNGKNSLFDGCFTTYVEPRAAGNDLNSIEEDKFITGVLENRYQNIFLESSPQVYRNTKMIKNLTGSQYHSIERKGKDQYPGYINCKHLFSANDQEMLKFDDTTDGWDRRFNVFESHYKWDADKYFMRYNTYYDTSFSDDLREITGDINNAIIFIYFAMYGQKMATKGFTKNFKFSFNEVKDKYSNTNNELKEIIEEITPEALAEFMSRNRINKEASKVLLYDDNKERLYNSRHKWIGNLNDVDDVIKMFAENGEDFNRFIAESDMYISVRMLQDIIGDTRKSFTFTKDLKKAYNIKEFERIYNNKPYAKIRWQNGKMQFLGE